MIAFNLDYTRLNFYLLSGIFKSVSVFHIFRMQVIKPFLSFVILCLACCWPTRQLASKNNLFKIYFLTWVYPEEIMLVAMKTWWQGEAETVNFANLQNCHDLFLPRLLGKTCIPSRQLVEELTNFLGSSRNNSTHISPVWSIPFFLQYHSGTSYFT